MILNTVTLKYTLAIIGFSFATTSALATTPNASQTLNKAVKCKTIDNVLERLNCYDEVFADIPVSAKSKVSETLNDAKQVKDNVGTVMPTASGEVAVATSLSARAAVSKNSVDTFGAENLKGNDENEAEEIDEITLNVQQIITHPRGEHTYVMANNQHWRESKPSRLNVKEGQNVIIKKGMFSSYYLMLEDSNRRISVKRTK